ncbi:MAG: isocitrate lyase/phosphoenolpyruvate mutase family protein, partial [Chloroflexota bacterium]
VWAGGLEISSSFGVPDANILTMADHLEAARWMAEAVDIPVVVDCDTGYGNSNNVIQAVRKFEAAGVAAICIEDKLFPKVNSFVAGRQELASVAEFVGKLMAAKNAQRSAAFMVIARVEALIAGLGQAEALRRARAYEAAGADAILIHSASPSAEEIARFAQAWEGRVPLVVVPTTYFGITAAELEQMGLKMVIYANHGLRAGISATLDVYQRILRDGSTAAVEDRIAPLSLVFELQGMPEMKQSEKTYLRGPMPPTRAIIPAAGDHLAERSLSNVAADVPLAMLDVNGKPLLARQTETLAQCRIQDVVVVGGYRRQQINVPGTRLIENPDWQATGDLASLMRAASEYDGRTLVVYADILFDAQTLACLLAAEAEVTLLVDRTWDRGHYSIDRTVDLVAVDKPDGSRRSLSSGAAHKVRRIGKQVPLDEANGEFCGIALFSAGGLALMRQLYARSGERRPFHEAESTDRASLTDLLQEAIDLGHAVDCVETSSGWLEIRSFEDYRLACKLVAR